MLRKKLLKKKRRLFFSIIKRHKQPGGALGPDHKPMALLFGLLGILQPNWLLKCCVALLASAWIVDLNYVGKSCLPSPFMRNKQCLEWHL